MKKVGVYHPIVFMAHGIAAWLGKYAQERFNVSWFVTQRLAEKLRESRIDVLIMGHEEWPLMVKQLEEAGGNGLLSFGSPSIVMLTREYLPPQAVEILFKLGVRTFVRYPQETERDLNLFNVALASACTGGMSFYDPHYISVDKFGRRREAGELSAREMQIATLIADGQSTKEVANVLGISAKTAETHRSNIMTKLGLHSVADLTRYILRLPERATTATQGA